MNKELKRLIKLKKDLDRKINQFKDGYFYIGVIRSFGSKYESVCSNEFSIQEDCNEYTGDSGIIDVFTNNGNANITNYSGGVYYVEDKDAYNELKEIEEIKKCINTLKELERNNNELFKEQYEEQLKDLQDKYIEPKYVSVDSIREHFLRRKKIERIVEWTK